jgi:benzoylformate decarboxylase
MLTTGAEMCYQSLKLSTVRSVFGSPGTTELSLLNKIANDSDMEYLFLLHENVAVGMADGFARASGHIGVANLHSAQGTLNAAGFIRIAQRDNSPVLVVAGAPSTAYALNEPNHFAYGIENMIRNITKWSWKAQSTAQIPGTVSRAINIALSAPKGPTYVAIPQDFLLGHAEMKPANGIWGNIANAVSEGSLCEVIKASRLLLTANRPLVFAGAEVGRAGAVNELTRVAELIGSPVISEALDRGPMLYSVNFPGDHALFLGYFDKRNSTISHFLNECDVLLEIGTKSTYPRVIGSLSPSTRIIQIDENSLEIAKNHSVALGIVGDIRSILLRIAEVLENEATSSQIAKCKQRFLKIQASTRSCKDDLRGIKLEGKPITPKQLVRALKEILDQAIIVDDSQSFGYYMKNYYVFRKPDTLYGSMASHLGWALPASLGVKLARPDRKIVCLVSDISLLFSIQSLHAASQYKIPVVIIVCNNHGSMSLKHEILSSNPNCENKVFNISSSAINLCKIAENFGLDSEHITDAKEIKEKIRKALLSDNPTLVEIDMSEKLSDWSESWYVPPEDKIP